MEEIGVRPSSRWVVWASRKETEKTRGKNRGGGSFQIEKGGRREHNGKIQELSASGRTSR
jgi:hypothetical protein